MNWTPEEMHGMFAGSFELEDYDAYVDEGVLFLSYEGVAGWLGLARLRLRGWTGG